MFRIGEFSMMGKTTVKTLRYYDEIGLLKPQQTDRWTGYRLYTTDQLIALHRIQALRQAGLGIDEIRCVLENGSQQAVLLRRRDQLLDALEQNRRQLSCLEFMLQNNEEEWFMDYVATIKELPGCIVYSKRLTVPSYDAYFELIPALGAQITAQYPDLKCIVPGYCFIIYLDREYREHDIHVEFCEAVDQLMPDFDGIHFKQMPPVTALSVLHRGPYSGLPKVYAFAFEWLKQNGYSMADAPRESYIDGIWNKESESDWLTELQIPIRKES